MCISASVVTVRAQSNRMKRCTCSSANAGRRSRMMSSTSSRIGARSAVPTATAACGGSIWRAGMIEGMLHFTLEFLREIWSTPPLRIIAIVILITFMAILVIPLAISLTTRRGQERRNN
jgi:hypothetical protein